MENITEHINIQVEELLSNDVIKWENITKAIQKLQTISSPLSDALNNLISQIQSHYENDLDLAKNIYKNKSLQYDLFMAKIQLDEMNSNEFTHDHEEEEQSDFENEPENEIILEGIKTTETFNFPLINEMESEFDTNKVDMQNTSICSCNSFEIPNPNYVDVSTQEENMDAKNISKLIYENNQYLKIAKSWKMQCEASAIQIQEMKKKKRNLYNYDD